MDILSALSLSPQWSARVWTSALVAIWALDILAAGDHVPGNTPREWLLRLTQWRSLNFWKRENIEAAKAAGKWSPWLFVFNLLPITGFLVPFALAALTGHFFHPWQRPPLGIAGFRGLGLVAGLGALGAAATYFLGSGASEDPVVRKGERLTPVAVLLGFLAGLLLWPVGDF